MESDLGKLFIGGISWDTTESRLKEYFRNYGEVVETVVMRDRTTGRARGFGFVAFADPAVAERVVMEKHVIDGRTVEAKKAVPRDDYHGTNRNNINVQGSPGPGRTKKIFVGGLASTVTESDFKSYFDQFGTITDVVVMYDHNTQRPRGFGFITYDSEEAVDRALHKTFHELNGKLVEVKRAVPKELSPGPVRSPSLVGYSYGLGRPNNFLNSIYPPQGYNISPIGSYGVGTNARFSVLASGRAGFSPIGSPGYGMNTESTLNPNFGGDSSFNNSLRYGHVLSPFFGANSNRFTTPIGYSQSNGRSNSILSPTTRNLWGNGRIFDSTNSGPFLGSGSGSFGVFGNDGVSWGSSPFSPQGVGRPFAAQPGGVSSGYGSGTIGRLGNSYAGLGRNGGVIGVANTMTFPASNGGYEGSFRNSYRGGLIPSWQSSSSELDDSGFFGYGLNNAGDVTVRSSEEYNGDFSISTG